jgi:hypothetical protein
MKTRRDYQVACPACRANIGRPCTGKEGERLQGVHFQRTTALRAASIAAFRSLYAPLTPNYGRRP